ncbi:MAG: aspartate/glutamate racemase family protein [Pseudomonadota bacterium]
MKTIAVILPVNNPDILIQTDIDCYNTSDVTYQLHYADTHLKDIKSKQMAKQGAAAIIYYAFGELTVNKLRDYVDIPIVSLGREAIKQASALSKKKFTIISAMLAHNAFWQPIIDDLGVSGNYVLSQHAPNLAPAEIRQDEALISKLASIAEKEIVMNEVDCFTLGCGSFIGTAPKLEEVLRSEFGPGIHVVDPVSVTFELLTKALLNN